MATTEKGKPVTTLRNALIKVTKVTQSGDEEFGIEPKTVCYLLIVTDKGTHRLNIGEGTVEKLKEILP